MDWRGVTQKGVVGGQRGRGKRKQLEIWESLRHSAGKNGKARRSKKGRKKRKGLGRGPVRAVIERNDRKILGEGDSPSRGKNNKKVGGYH